jgi:hypothetical protein
MSPAVRDISRASYASGAAAVTGVDISERMIELAHAQEAADPLGIDYQSNAASPGSKRTSTSGIRVATRLLPRPLGARAHVLLTGLPARVVDSSPSPPTLISPSLSPPRPTANTALTLPGRSDFRRRRILWTMHMDDSSFEIENYYPSVIAYESAFRDAGFAL